MSEETPLIKTDANFEVHQSENSGVPVVVVQGEVDVSTAPQLRDELFALSDASSRLAVADLTHVSFVDSTALGVLVSAVKRFRSDGGDLRLVVTQAHISKVLDITGLTEVFSVYRTVDEAVKE